MELTPSDTVLLAAERFAALSLFERVGEEIKNGLLYGVGVLLALGLAYSYATEHGADPLLCCGAVMAGLVAGFVWKRFVRPDRTLLGEIDQSKLERMLVSAALLANEQQGLLRLTRDGIELRAEPTGTAPRWPAETLEQNLLRGLPADHPCRRGNPSVSGLAEPR